MIFVFSRMVLLQPSLLLPPLLTVLTQSRYNSPSLSLSSYPSYLFSFFIYCSSINLSFFFSFCLTLFYTPSFLSIYFNLMSTPSSLYSQNPGIYNHICIYISFSLSFMYLPLSSFISVASFLFYPPLLTRTHTILLTEKI